VGCDIGDVAILSGTERRIAIAGCSVCRLSDS
jgi:hypothetical protein